MSKKNLISMALVTGLTAVSVGFAVANASAESRFWTHPTDEFGDPTGDIRAYSLALDTSTFTVSVALGAFDLASAQSSTFNVELDVNGDGVADFNINKEDAARAEVLPGPAFSGSDPVDCAGTSLSYNSEDKAVIMAASATCIGSPSSLRGSYYYSVAENADFAPSPDRFSPAVSNQPDGTASPAPTTPPPTTGARSVGRLSGTDRYSTAVEISKHVFPNGAPVVFLARADSFADALAGGTLSRGPILLVPQCGAVPEVVKAEVRRLGAGEVVALGGPGAVCDAVLSAVASA